MRYVDRLNRLLKPRRPSRPKALDLFAGCGGLSLGLESVGFDVEAFERDEDACMTYTKNLRGECHQVELHPGFVYPNCRVLVAGPPCQPFSVTGNQRGGRDRRNGFAIFISAVAQLKPDLWMFENVRGLAIKNRRYFLKLMRDLRALGYEVDYRVLDAKEFGVPQNRQRLIVVGHHGGFSWPSASQDLVTAGEALGRMAIAEPRGSRYVTQRMSAYIRRYEKASCCAIPRDLHLHLPARTLTCRNLAGATGDMHRVLLPSGRRRLLRPREAARLQSFPDWFDFVGSEASQLTQIGNAVPPLVAHALATQIKAYVGTAD